MLYSFSAGIAFRRQNLTSSYRRQILTSKVGPRTERVQVIVLIVAIVFQIKRCRITFAVFICRHVAHFNHRLACLRRKKQDIYTLSFIKTTTRNDVTRDNAYVSTN